MNHNEKKFIELCQAGNAESFGRLYDEYVEKIYNFIYYRTYHKETAEDLTSIVFTKALGNIKKFDIAKGFFKAWLYRIARNSVIDYYRGFKNEKNIEDVWDLAENNDIEKKIDEKNQLENIKKYLKNLTSEQRDIIIMRIWDQMSYQEISVALEKTEESCRMMFSRTIKKLRDDLPLALFIALLLHF